MPRALVNRETTGLVELVADADTDRILGATVVAEAAGEVIQSAVLAVEFGITTARHSLPPLPDDGGRTQAGRTDLTRDVHRLSCCAA